jgi:hypothetical protein
MIAASPMHWYRALLLIAAVVLTLSGRGWSQTAPVTQAGAPTNVEEWRATDLSILDFVADGYDLVSVISSSAHARLYFFTKPGKIVKCREETTPRSPPPIPLSPTPGQAGTFAPPPTPGQAGTFTPAPPGQAGAFMPLPDSVIASVRTEFECAELSRRTSRQ